MSGSYGLIKTGTQRCGVSAGDVFGRLRVVLLGQREDDKKCRARAVCQCSCGSAPKVVAVDALTSGRQVSCGCHQAEQRRARNGAKVTHGYSKSAHFARWANMMARCHKPGSVSYARYGGRGIKVCERWHDVANFIADLPDGYFQGAQLDRIDNDGDYEPGNIRWVLPLENSSNRRSNVYMTMNGRTMTAMDWSREIGLKYETILQRKRKGWSDVDCLTSPVNAPGVKTDYGRATCRERAKKYEFQGESLPLKEIAARVGLSYHALYERLKRGATLEDAVRPRTP
ncbi:hypothetical protein [Azotobacter vinelandii]|uniref:hypothetical protein n=1 Tax=Azotobacter vinelandii TaxID=354 RepID=UPI002666A780|nr:hypothetical protein [Azotobacter vinelandii]WKN20817.1 hypothetical protein AVAEIV_003842 [Azotobacter vinelandii]